VTQRPPLAERLMIDGPAGALQALLELPQSAPGAGAGAPGNVPDTPRHTPRAFGVVCHPHPLHGGTLDNKVVWTVARAFVQLGAPAIRFNFRGVGASEGRYDDGRGETADALAAIDFGRRRFPGCALWLGGFSFGAAVAVRAAGEAQPDRLVLVAPGITRVDVHDAAPPQCPWLIVQGDADEVVPSATVLEWAQGLSPPQTVRVLAGAGHFFHGRINELRDVVAGFMQGVTQNEKAR
jgi:alpha/beta superfamily hydrolase